MRRIQARRKNARAFRLRFSQSLAALAAALASASLPLAVVNPRQIRYFAKALGKLGPRPMQSMPKPSRYSPKRLCRRRGRAATPQAQALGELVARCRQVVEMIGMEANRRRRAAGKLQVQGFQAYRNAIRQIRSKLLYCPLLRRYRILLT
jgi:transposase